VFGTGNEAPMIRQLKEIIQREPYKRIKKEKYVKMAWTLLQLFIIKKSICNSISKLNMIMSCRSINVH